MATNDNGSNKTLIVLIPVVLALIGLASTILDSEWFAARMMPTQVVVQQPVEETVATVPASEAEEEVSPTEETAEAVAPASPLEEIFPQIGAGEDFDYVNSPAVFTGNIVENDCTHSGTHGLKLIYDIKNSGGGGWGTLWANAPEGAADLTGYSTLVFWVKGGTGSEKFQVSISDSLKREESVDSTDLLVLSQDWQEARVQLNLFSGVNLGLVNNLTFDVNEKKSNGVLCIDDISLE